MRVNKKRLLQEKTITRLPPYNLIPEHQKCFAHEYQRTIPDVNLFELQNVNISTEGIVFKKLRVFAPALLHKSRKKKYGLKYLLKNYIKRKRLNLSRREKYILAFDEWSNGYFHWICDVLPRLVAAESYLSDSYFLLPEKYNTPFIRGTLSAFSFKGIQVIPENSYAQAPSLIIPGHTAPTGNYYPEILLKVKEKLLRLCKNNSGSGEKVYISRKKAAYRHIENEEQVIRTAEANGFATIFFEDHTIAEQIVIAASAKYMVGLHGAGLTNILFMNENTAVLELKHAGDKHNLSYYSLAAVQKIKYHYLFCEHDGKNTRLSNIKVNIDSFQKAIDQLLSN